MRLSSIWKSRLRRSRSLPEGAVLAGEDETEIQWLLNAPIHKVEAAIREVLVRSAYRALYLLNQFKSSDRKRMDLLEQRVTEYHIAIGAVEPGQESAYEQVIEHSSQTVQATDYSEAEQQYLYQEPAAEDSILLEAADEVSARDIEESLAAQYLKEGNLVEVNATLFNGDKTWNGLRCPPVLEVETKPRPQIIRVGDRVEIVSERMYEKYKELREPSNHEPNHSCINESLCSGREIVNRL